MRLRNNGLLFFLTILSNFSFGQALSLDDIFKIYSLDSISLKQFCVEKKFTLEMIDEDDWVFEYSIESSGEKKIYVTRTFPKDKQASPFVRYYFSDQQQYKNFEDSIRRRGFVETKYKSIGKKDRTGISTKHYLHDTSKMEISLEKHGTGTFRYALTLTLLSFE